MPRQTVAAVIPTKNVVGIIEPTLESLRFCDQVIIVDMFSTDGTRELCEQYPNVRFFQREDYIYGNFNYGVDQATTDWIIRLDSDEIISDRLRESIEEVLERNPQGLDAYEAFCHLYFFGKRLYHGFGNQWRTTIFRKGVARYAVKGEHESLTLTRPQGRLEGHYSHYTNPTISTWMAKTNYYTDRDVERVTDPQVPSRWRVVYETLRNFQRLYLRPHWLIRDGYLGFVVAGVAAFSIFLGHAKTWEKAERLRESRARANDKRPATPDARAAEPPPRRVVRDGAASTPA